MYRVPRHLRNQVHQVPTVLPGSSSNRPHSWCHVYGLTRLVPGFRVGRFAFLPWKTCTDRLHTNRMGPCAVSHTLYMAPARSHSTRAFGFVELDPSRTHGNTHGTARLYTGNRGSVIGAPVPTIGGTEHLYAWNRRQWSCTPNTPEALDPRASAALPTVFTVFYVSTSTTGRRQSELS